MVALRQTRIGYWVAAAVALGGVVIAVLWGLAGYRGVAERIDRFPRADIPGQVSVPIDEVGTYLVFYEAVNADRVPVFDIAVTDPAGTGIAVERYGAELRFDRGERTVLAVATFDAEARGDHIVVAAGAMPPGARFSVGRTPVPGIASMLGAVVLLLVVLGLAVATAVTTLILRAGRSRAPEATPIRSGNSPRTPAGAR